MFRAAVRSGPRALRHSSVVASTSGRRFASTAPADKKYTWKGTATRWGLAIGALYWYNTSPIFADEAPSHLSPEPPQFSESELPTVDAIVEEKRKQIEARLKAKEEQTTKEGATTAATVQPTKSTQDGQSSPEQLEQEAENEGAFNPETGEINWDCPCLGGMAHGPCGEEFKAAFSCFVYSDVEPKGMDCVDKFQHMQDCFRKYPEVYGEEIAEEEAAEAEAAAVASNSPATLAEGKDLSKDATTAPVSAPAQTEKKPASKPELESKPKKQKPTVDEPKAKSTDAPKKDTPAVVEKKEAEGIGADPMAKALSEGVDDRGIPKRSFDATSANVSAPK